MPRRTLQKSDEAREFLRALKIAKIIQRTRTKRFDPIGLADSLYHRAMAVEDRNLFLEVMELYAAEGIGDIDILLTETESAYTVALAKRPLSPGQPVDLVQAWKPRKQRAASSRKSAKPTEGPAVSG